VRRNVIKGTPNIQKTRRVPEPAFVGFFVGVPVAALALLGVDTTVLMISTVLTSVSSPEGPFVTTVFRDVNVIGMAADDASIGPGVCVAGFDDGDVCCVPPDEEPPSYDIDESVMNLAVNCGTAGAGGLYGEHDCKAASVVKIVL